MSLSKTTLSKTKRGTPTGPEDEEQTFLDLESRLRRGELAVPSRWGEVARADPGERRWILHAMDLIAKAAEKAGPQFDTFRAAALLVDRAPRRRFDPGTAGRYFEREVMSVSGMLEATLPATLTPPDDATTARLTRIHQTAPPRPTRVALARTLTERAAWWEAPIRLTDLTWLEGVASSLQRWMRDDGPLHAAVCPDGPLHDGFDFARSIADAGARDDTPAHRLALLRDEFGYPAEPGEQWDDPALGVLLANSPAHVTTGTWTYVPASVPGTGWGPEEAWPGHLYRLLTHELLHRLAHPAYLQKAEAVPGGRVLTEEVVELLTAEFVEASRLDPELGPLVPDVVESRHTEAAEEIRELAGPEGLKAAYFLGRIEFIGLT
ncbi:hypothetical protein FDA94_01040 [Herbidospora galbida]|uniref:Uncharacterized protein n=1 Tax=Herbidospora galbida TaxID=2575442 RepID=A0A4U3MP96_9ACTN|nr:hypothetical protein [Herbidospora galbida]TKK91411.1 hypothetical protein FDA94_01040 [Herbidospora galbida]